jgi:hypothetical protein
MADRLRGYAVANVDGKMVAIDSETDLSTLPSDVVSNLRDRGAISGVGASSSGSGGSLNVASASVDDIASHIESESLNASDTVALAGDDPVLAQKVLDAENAAHGGDGRTTVVSKLEKLAEG